MACEGWSQVDPTCYLSEAAKQASGSVMDQILEASVQAATAVLQLALSWWMVIPTPSPFQQDFPGGVPPQGTEVTAIPIVNSLWQSLAWLAVVVMVFGVLAAAARAVWSNQVIALRAAFEMFLRYLAVTTFGVMALWALILSTDAYASWIMARANASGGTSTVATAEQMVKSASLIQLGFTGGGLASLLILLSSLAQVGFMIFRSALLLLVVVVLPVAAAATGFEVGQEMFKKILRWLVALILYKPVAAVIYSLGTGLLLRNQAAPALPESVPDAVSRSGEAWYEVVIALIILTLAALALPALVKFLAPPAGVGASSASSGGAMAAAIGTGAIAIGTMGAGAGAMAAGSAGQAGAAAGPTGANPVPANPGGEAPSGGAPVPASGGGGTGDSGGTDASPASAKPATAGAGGSSGGPSSSGSAAASSAPPPTSAAASPWGPPPERPSSNGGSAAGAAGQSAAAGGPPAAGAGAGGATSVTGGSAGIPAEPSSGAGGSDGPAGASSAPASGVSQGSGGMPVSGTGSGPAGGGLGAGERAAGAARDLAHGAERAVDDQGQ